MTTIYKVRTQEGIIQKTSGSATIDFVISIDKVETPSTFEEWKAIFWEQGDTDDYFATDTTQLFKWDGTQYVAGTYQDILNAMSDESKYVKHGMVFGGTQHAIYVCDYEEPYVLAKKFIQQEIGMLRYIDGDLAMMSIDATVCVSQPVYNDTETLSSLPNYDDHNKFIFAFTREQVKFEGANASGLLPLSKFSQKNIRYKGIYLYFVEHVPQDLFIYSIDVPLFVVKGIAYEEGAFE